MERTRLLLVRHGETQWNRDLKIQGQLDILLSEVGREQAKAVAVRLAEEKVDALYTSDLARAKETAEIIAERHELPVRTESSLREMCFGEWQGLSLAEIQERFPEDYASYRAQPVSVSPPQGESCADLACRVQGGLAAIAARHPGQTIVVVSHGGALKAAMCGFLGLELSKRGRFVLDNCGVSRVDLNPQGPVVVYLNDTSHLRADLVKDVEP